MVDDAQQDRIARWLEEAEARVGPVPDELLEQARELWTPSGRRIAEHLRGRGDIDLTTDEIMELTRGG